MLYIPPNGNAAPSSVLTNHRLRASRKHGGTYLARFQWLPVESTIRTGHRMANTCRFTFVTGTAVFLARTHTSKQQSTATFAHLRLSHRPQIASTAVRSSIHSPTPSPLGPLPHLTEHVLLKRARGITRPRHSSATHDLLFPLSTYQGRVQLSRPQSWTMKQLIPRIPLSSPKPSNVRTLSTWTGRSDRT